MTVERTSLEVIALSVEEAIEKGLEDLNLSVDDVDIEIMDEGSKGFLGLGTRQSRIKIIVKEGVPLPDSIKSRIIEVAPKLEHIAEAKPPKNDNLGEDSTLRVARETVSELLEKMQISAQVTSTFVESDDPEEQKGVLVEVTGTDLSILIGRKSETLNALQYIASLIVGKRLEKWMPLTIDVEGYRGRREHQLRQLALKMAEQAIATGRRQILEPMPANERRIVHLALRDHPQVVTESTGEEPNRKLTIVLKKE
jgi:spoIIIJ-associated protein